MTSSTTQACADCPWLRANQGRKTPNGAYTIKNLAKTWNRIRRGLDTFICPTHTRRQSAKDPNTHPDPVECPAAIALIYREIAKLRLAAGPSNKISPNHIQDYIAENPMGLTKHGITHWTIVRPKLPPQMGGAPIPPIPLRMVLDQDLIGRPQPGSNKPGSHKPNTPKGAQRNQHDQSIHLQQPDLRRPRPQSHPRGGQSNPG